MKGSDFAELRAFAAVIRQGSFARAAAELGVTPSALSQTIRALETRLDLRLFNRTTRSVAPTEAGARLSARLLPLLDDLAGVLGSIEAERHMVAGRLRLNVLSLGVPLLGDLLPPFLAAHPGVEVEVVVEDRLVDIVRAGFDAGIRLGEALEGDMVAVPISGELRMIVVGAPDYLARRGVPEHPRDLAQHAGINMTLPSDGSIYRWELERAGTRLRIAPPGPLTCNTSALRLAAARAGLGLTFVFAHEVVEDLAAGRLVEVLADWTPPMPGCSLYFPGRRNLPPPLRAFADHVRAWRRGGGGAVIPPRRGS